MKAIILCAGKGTRLAQISTKIPKVMVEIGGKPLLERHIEQLKRSNVKNIAINLHHLPEKITDYFGDGKKFGVHITYSREHELLGTGGALLPLKRFLNEETLIVYGDVFLSVDFEKMLAFHKKRHAVVSAAIHESKHPEDSDLVEYDKKFRIGTILRKPHKLIPKNPYNLAALYLVNPEIKQYLIKKTPFDIAHDLLPKLLNENVAVYGYNTDEMMMDIGTPERLAKAEKLLKQ